MKRARVRIRARATVKFRVWTRKRIIVMVNAGL